MPTQSDSRRPRWMFQLPRSVALFWGTTLLLCASAMQPVRADPEGGAASIPPQFSVVACYELVQDAGRMIAWARWERQFPVEKTRSGGFPNDTPVWAVDLMGEWITDAYQWQVTDEQVYEWAAELGSVDNLPHADRLTVHETIAIWMRRIGRQCSGHSPHA